MALFRCYTLLKRRACTHHKTHFQGPPLQSALKLKPMRLLKMFLTYDKWAIGPLLDGIKQRQSLFDAFVFTAYWFNQYGQGIWPIRGFILLSYLTHYGGFKSSAVCQFSTTCGINRLLLPVIRLSSSLIPKPTASLPTIHTPSIG